MTHLTNLQGFDQAWAHVRYRPDTGHLWLTTASGGFWVLELEPQLRAALGLPARPTLHPQGASVRPPASHGLAARSAAQVQAYCALSTATIL